MRRRHLLALAPLCLAGSPSLAGKPHPLWLLGSWQSDRELTMQNWHFQGRSVDPQKRDQVASLFGTLVWHVSPNLIVTEHSGHKARLHYRIASQSSSSISLLVASPDQPGAYALTVFRSAQEQFFIKTGTNLEYFRKITA